MIGWSRDIDDAGWRTWEPPSRDAPDSEALRQHLGRRIWRDAEAPAPIVEVRIGKRRQSRQGMTALYTVVFNEPPDRRVEQVYVGCEPPAGALDAEYESARVHATITPVLGRAVVHVPEANLVLVAFPNDPQMHVPDEDAMRACMARMATRLSPRGQRWRVADPAFSVLRYVPGRRVTLGCRGRFETDAGTGQPFAFIAKAFRKPDLARSIHRSLVALSKHVSVSDAVRLPRPAGFDEHTGLVLMEELPGEDLLRTVRQVDVGTTMQAVGQMLAAFHRLPHVASRRLSPREKLDDVVNVTGKIETFFPAALPRLRACLSRCLAVRWHDDAPDVLLHGAFRPKHVFVHAGRLALIDVDGMCVGHPAHDVGHFLSALYFLEAQDILTTADRGTAVERFLAGYSAEAPWRLEPAAVLWYTAALLVHKQARKYVVHLHDDCGDKVDRVLTLAEGALAACEKLRAGASLDVVRSVLC